MTRPSTERGQTALDFVVAMGVFLLAVTFVLAFIPSMFAPFFGMGVGDELTADRAASTLIDQELSGPDGPAQALNISQTDSFFTECETGTNLSEKLHLRTEDAYVEISDTDGEPIAVNSTTLVCGEDSGDPDTVSTRVVTVDGEQGTLRVKVF